MKKEFSLEYQGQVFLVQVERQGDSISINRDGQVYKVGVGGAAPVVANEYLSAQPASSPAAAPAQATAPAPVSVAAPAPAPSAGGAGGVTAPVTGSVKEVKVKVGDSVSSGDLVMILEAMKMDIEVFASGSGAVKDILVGPGDSVREHQPLINLG